MDTVVSRLKSSLRWLLASLKDISWALPPVIELILYVVNGFDGRPAILTGPVLSRTAWGWHSAAWRSLTEDVQR